MQKIIITALATLALPMLVQAASNPESDPNNLADLNGCANFSKENPVTKKFEYVLNGQRGTVGATLYPVLNQCLAKLKQKTSCPGCAHAKKEDQDDADAINNVPQNDALQELADNIQKITADKNDQAHIAISLVQGLPYENHDKDTYDYPYEVAFDGTGICNETAKLAILLLKQLGFGTAMLTFEKDDHQAFGIKCDPQYSYQNSGYCFVEATTRSIITDPVGEKTEARVNQISDGLTFDASKDYQDAQKYLNLLDRKDGNGADNTALKELEKNYGI